MLPSAHFFMVIIIWYVFYVLKIHIKMMFLVMLISGFLIDLDILFTREHRRSPFHNFLFWAIISIFLSFTSLMYSLSLIASFTVHIILDSIDWGVYPFYPISKKSLGLRILAKKTNLDPQKESIITFIKANLSDKRIMLLEITIDAIGLVILAHVINQIGFFEFLMD